MSGPGVTSANYRDGGTIDSRNGVTAIKPEPWIAFARATCAACSAVIGPSDTVVRGYRLRSRQWHRPRRSMVSLCIGCAGDRGRYRDPEACEACGRMVLIPRDGRLRWRVFCSDGCRHKDSSLRQTERRFAARKTRLCSCGAEIRARGRSDRHFCSNACRQRAYRKRSPTGPDPAPC